MSSRHFQYGMQALQGVIWYPNYIKEPETLLGTVFSVHHFLLNFLSLQGRQPTFAQKVRRKYQKQQNKKAQKLNKEEKTTRGKGRPRQNPRPKKGNTMTKVKTKQPSKASQKRQKDSLAVTALENATVAALQVGQ